MENSLKSWVCPNCKFLGLAGDAYICSSVQRYNSGDFTGYDYPVVRATIPHDFDFDIAECSYKEQGDNGIAKERLR